jgi:hypothetical protein
MVFELPVVQALLVGPFEFAAPAVLPAKPTKYICEAPVVAAELSITIPPVAQHPLVPTFV